MKALFLIKSEKTPSSRIRVRDLTPHLEAEGIRCEVWPLPPSMLMAAWIYPRVKDFDVVVLQKRLLNWVEFQALRSFSKRLVFDFDDAIYLRNASPSRIPADYQSETRLRKFKTVLAGADAVVAANRVLAGKVSELAPEKRVFIVPSSVDVSGVKPKSSFALSSPPVLGWVGGKSTLRYLEWLEGALVALAARRSFILKVVADACPSLPGVDVRFVKWSLEGQYQEMESFDIGLMPLSQDPFSEGKSAYKLLQYMAAGVPSVCSPVGMNADVAKQEGDNCLTAARPPDFLAQIERLLDEQPLREAIASRGRNLAERHFSNEAAARALATALRSVAP